MMDDATHYQPKREKRIVLRHWRAVPTYIYASPPTDPLLQMTSSISNSNPLPSLVQSRRCCIVPSLNRAVTH